MCARQRVKFRSYPAILEVSNNGNQTRVLLRQLDRLLAYDLVRSVLTTLRFSLVLSASCQLYGSHDHEACTGPQFNGRCARMRPVVGCSLNHSMFSAVVPGYIVAGRDGDERHARSKGLRMGPDYYALCPAPIYTISEIA